MNWPKLRIATSAVMFMVSSGFTANMFTGPWYMYWLGVALMLWFAYDLIGEIDRYFGFKDK